MQIEINGKRNITLDFNAPKKFRLVKDGAEIPYIRTGKNSFRLSKPVEGFVELEEIVEQPRYMQPVQLQPQQMTVINPQDVDRLNEAVRQMALVNPQDVEAINNAAEKIDSSQMYIAEKQQQLEATQTYIDQQQQRLNETALGIQALETDNSQRLDGAENAILNLAGEISNAQTMAVDGMNKALNKIEEQGILLQTEIDTKADKEELESLKKDFEEKSDQFSNAMSSYSGGYAYDTLPQGGEAGQILAKRTDRQGDYVWINQTPVIVKSETIPTASEKYKGEVYQYVGETGDYTHGYIYECQQDGNSYGWVRLDVQPNDSEWGKIRGDISNQTDLQNALNGKYDASNPSGYQANVIETVKVNGTALTPSSKAVNITVPAAQVNSDWNASSGVAQILNKPTIPTVNNATLTIKQGGITKGTFTANASSNVTIALDAGSSVNIDNKSITKNTSDELQTVGVIDSNNTTNAIKTWTGTKAQYDAIVTKDTNTLYNITDDTDVSLTILEALYPVGSVYITTANTCPLSALISGSTWELVSSGRVLQGADSGHSAGTTIEAGLPNITGNIESVAYNPQTNGALVIESLGGYGQSGASAPLMGVTTISLNASNSNSIYGNSSTVQPPAYIVNIYRRTA